jgi:hypothetical protein
MPDITMCKGEGCPIKNNCYRNIAKPSEYQSYFEESPFDGERCEMFWGENATQVYEQLKEILKVKNENL